MEEILHQSIGSLSHYLQGFRHTRWCRIFPSTVWIVFHWPLKSIHQASGQWLFSLAWYPSIEHPTAPTRNPITSHRPPFKAPTFLHQAFIIAKTPHVVIELTVSCMEVRSGLTQLCQQWNQLNLLRWNCRWRLVKVSYKVGPLPVISRVITPISRVITPDTHL